ncbi:hypothetical protein [Tessaracoccus coleopterorum]|uniref:hypothetical protein n=1 Tax=Tessaracoccus coleopterorum TaxID=2714950 RepID=UPI001E48471E|nr:hypothetical protein [Tessaracoccus coleopterorum]
MSEADRIAWLQNTASAPRVQGGATTRVGLYEPLLPYAVIFGPEDSWVELIGQRIEGSPTWRSGCRRSGGSGWATWSRR